MAMTWDESAMTGIGIGFIQWGALTFLMIPVLDPLSYPMAAAGFFCLWLVGKRLAKRKGW